MTTTQLRALKKAMKNAVSNANIQIRGGIPDPAITYKLRVLCDEHGYGNVMATVSSLWRQKDPVGAFAFGPCIGTVDRFLDLAKKAGFE
jgi:hypothetical protein